MALESRPLSDNEGEETESDEGPQEEMPLWRRQGRSSLRRMSSALGLSDAKPLCSVGL